MLGNNLKSLLDDLGMKQRRFAQMAAVSDKLISQFINGHILFDPTDDDFRRVFAIYHTLKANQESAFAGELLIMTAAAQVSMDAEVVRGRLDGLGE